LRRGDEFSRGTERIASRSGGALLFVLAAYIVLGAAWSLWAHHGGWWIDALTSLGIVWFVLKEAREASDPRDQTLPTFDIEVRAADNRAHAFVASRCLGGARARGLLRVDVGDVRCRRDRLSERADGVLQGWP
jgi:hypothetical protein